jgi:broad specificity phosphatase PhoE
MPERTDHQNKYHFILLRHGESRGNAEGRIQGQSDFPLTDYGRQQAQLLARRWLAEGKTFDSIISSPLVRCQETAEMIAQAMAVPVEYDALWMERDYGKLSGMDHQQAILVEGHPLYAHLYQPVGETGESVWDLYLRGGQAVRSLLALNPGSYLVVSHGGILNVVLYAILGITPQDGRRGVRFQFNNASFASLSYLPSENIWQVEGLNDHDHWRNPQ